MKNNKKLTDAEYLVWEKSQAEHLNSLTDKELEAYENSFTPIEPKEVFKLVKKSKTKAA